MVPQHEAAGVVRRGHVQKLLEKVLELLGVAGFRLGRAPDDDHAVFLQQQQKRERKAEEGAENAAISIYNGTGAQIFPETPLLLLGSSMEANPDEITPMASRFSFSFFLFCVAIFFSITCAVFLSFSPSLNVTQLRGH